MKTIIHFLILACPIIFLFPASGETLKLSKEIFNNSDITFRPHVGAGAFDSYLTMEINYGPIPALFKQLVSAEKLSLKTRGEAHITVITPPEFSKILKRKITMDEINELAQSLEIQKSLIEINCLGKGQTTIQGHKEATYYLVAKSDQLVKIRQAIEDLYIQKGGDPKLFEATHFYPHMTLGFTSRDLHEEDGVIKDIKSCIFPIEFID